MKLSPETEAELIRKGATVRANPVRVPGEQQRPRQLAQDAAPVALKADKTELTIWLPFPPSVNHYWRHVGHKVLISSEGRKFRKTVKDLCAIFGSRMEGRLDVTITLFPPDRRRRDVDNYAKSLLDALMHGGVFDDDEQIDMLRIQRKNIRTTGQALVTIKRIEAP